MSLTVLTAGDVDDLIGRFATADLISKGLAFVLGFDAIRERSGGRWAMRQDSVREFIERQFHKYFLHTDHLVRLDDVNFLVIQPFESPLGAQARALKLLTEVLQYFLGAGARQDVRLSRVTHIGPDGVESAEVDVSEADLARLAKVNWDAIRSLANASSPAHPAPAAEQNGPLMSEIEHRSKGSGAALKGDRSYEAVFVVEPVWGIKQRAVVSYMLRPLVFEPQAHGLAVADLKNASPGDLVRLDLLALAEAQRLFDQHGGQTRFALHVPISHVSLGLAVGRQSILSMLQRMTPASSSSILVVLTGLDAGVPHSRIVELTSALAGRCRAVIALAPDLDCRTDRWREAHLSGVAVDLSLLAEFNEQVSVRRMSEFAARCEGVAPALIAYSVPSKAILLAAWAAGFTHVGGDLIDTFSEGVLQPLRLNPIDLYRDKM